MALEVKDIIVSGDALRMIVIDSNGEEIPYHFGGLSNLGFGNQSEFMRWVAGIARKVVADRDAKLAQKAVEEQVRTHINHWKTERFTVPNRPTTLRFTKPAPGDELVAGETDVSGEVDESVESLVLNGLDVSDALTKSGRFRVSIPFQAGASVLVGIAANSIGETLRVTIPISVVP